MLPKKSQSEHKAPQAPATKSVRDSDLSARDTTDAPAPATGSAAAGGISMACAPKRAKSGIRALSGTTLALLLHVVALGGWVISEMWQVDEIVPKRRRITLVRLTGALPPPPPPPAGPTNTAASASADTQVATKKPAKVTPKVAKVEPKLVVPEPPKIPEPTVAKTPEPVEAAETVVATESPAGSAAKPEAGGVSGGVAGGTSGGVLGGKAEGVLGAQGDGLTGLTPGMESDLIAKYRRQLEPQLRRYLFYPEEAEEDEIEGTVIVRITVNHDGALWAWRWSAAPAKTV